MTQKQEKTFFYLLIGAATMLRCLTYFRNRSLFYDEINLARNYAELDYFSLFGNLDYNQHAPPFFSWVVKFCTDIFGMNEYALRLFPFVAGVASILLFYKIARYFLEGYGLGFALILFGFSSYLLEYGTEAKQYSTDVFWSCVLLYFILKSKEMKPIFWAILGATSIWFSMPMVFVLAAVGIYFLYPIFAYSSNDLLSVYDRKTDDADGADKIGFSENDKQKIRPHPLYPHNQRSYPILLATIFTTWLISFGLLYWVNLRHSLDSPHLEGFHNAFFLKVNNLAQTGEILVGIIRSLVGRTAVPILFTFACFFLGCWTLWLRKKEHFLLLVTPIFLCLLASFLQQYSLIVRLTVFFFPMLILLVGIGFSSLYVYCSGLKKPFRQIAFSTLGVLAILCFAGRSALPYIFQPLKKEDARTVLENLAKEDLSATTLLITDCGKPGFLFYTKYREPSIQIQAKQVIIQEEYSPLAPFSKEISDKSFWLFDSHTFGENYKLLHNEINDLGRVKKELKSKSAFAIFLEKKK